MPKVTAEYLEAQKSRILDAAFACFRRRGFHATTMKDIYREAGLSAGAVYHYFRSKEEMVTAAIDRETEERTGLIAGIRSLEPSSEEALQTLGRHLFGRFRDPDFEEQSRLDIECWPEIMRDERMLAAIRRQFAALRKPLFEMVSQAQTDMQIPDEWRLESEHLVTLLIALYQGLRLQYLIEDEAVDPEAVLELLLKLLTAPERVPASPSPGDEGA